MAILIKILNIFLFLEQRQIEEQLRVQYIASDEVWIPPGSPDHVPENQPPISILPLNNFSETHNRWNSQKQQQQQPPPIYKYKTIFVLYPNCINCSCMSEWAGLGRMSQLLNNPIQK